MDATAGASTLSHASSTPHWLDRRADRLNEARRRMFSDSCAYVSAHPVKSVGIAIVVGLLVGRLIR